MTDEMLLEVIARDIGDFCMKWGRISVTQTKEKYGTVRVYCSIGVWGFHSLIHPGHVYNQWTEWLWRLDLSIGIIILKPFNPLIIWYQTKIYRLAYKRSVYKYPYLKNAILCCSDYSNLLVNL